MASKVGKCVRYIINVSLSMLLCMCVCVILCCVTIVSPALTLEVLVHLHQPFSSSSSWSLSVENLSSYPPSQSSCPAQVYRWDYEIIDFPIFLKLEIFCIIIIIIIILLLLLIFVGISTVKIISCKISTH